MKNTITILIIALFGIELHAGTTGKLTGVVKDSETGEPLIGCNIMLDGTYIGASTNDKGEYIILNIPPNDYSVRFEMIGYKKLIQEGVLIVSDKTFTLNPKTSACESIIEGDNSNIFSNIMVSKNV